MSFHSSLPDPELRRTARQTLLPGFGVAGQEALHRSHVLIIGAGGLGCPAAQTLAATGVGHITLIDDDLVDLTNIHRQILFGASDVGQPKVEVTARRLRELQPGITGHARQERLTADNAVEIFRGVDLVLDGSDVFTTKFLAADAAEITGIPLVWGTVLRYHGEVALWWTSTSNRGVGLRDLYASFPDPANSPNCATAGVLGVTTSVVAGLMATEAIGFLSGLSDPADRVGKLMLYDAMPANLRTFTVSADPARDLATSLDAHAVPAVSCAVPDEPAPLAHLLDDPDVALLDLREVGEKALSDLPSETSARGYHLPTTEWEKSPSQAESLLEVLAASGWSTVVAYCASGVRSGVFVDKFCDYARDLGLELYDLPGGVTRNA